MRKKFFFCKSERNLFLFLPLFYAETKKIKDHLAINKDKIRYALIALGGITDKNILQVQEMGFKGAACIGYIWENANPIGQLKKLQVVLQS